jgi:hypothetical protein
VNWSVAHGGPSILRYPTHRYRFGHRQEFGLLRNRPDASLLLRARWIAQTRRRFGTQTNGKIKMTLKQFELKTLTREEWLAMDKKTLEDQLETLSKEYPLELHTEARRIFRWCDL